MGGGGGLTIRTADGTRNIEHLCRLMAENLAKIELEAPVLDRELVADDVRPLEVASDSLPPGTVNKGESLNLLLERMAAGLGPDRVLRPVLVGDLRPIVHRGSAATPVKFR